jgi:guanylate kinase
MRPARVGFGNFLSLEHARKVLAPQSATVQRLVREQKTKGLALDLTNGRRTTAVIPLDDGRLVLVAVPARRLKAQGFAIDLGEFKQTRKGAGALLVVLTGPSGAGKDSILNHLKSLKRPYYISVNTTTREPRAGEKEGIDYHFVSKGQFQRMLDDDELLEHAVVYGQEKGVPKAPIQAALAQGHDVLMRTDIQGARAIKELVPGAITILVAPPSEVELRRRVRERGGDSTEQVRLREKTAVQEMEAAKEFDYTVVNDELERAAADVEKIMSRERKRAGRQAVQV